MPKEQEPAQVLKRFKKEGWTLYTGKAATWSRERKESRSACPPPRRRYR